MNNFEEWGSDECAISTYAEMCATFNCEECPLNYEAKNFGCLNVAQNNPSKLINDMLDAIDQIEENEVSEEDDVKYCTSCGAELTADAAFCTKCGQKQ